MSRFFSVFAALLLSLAGCATYPDANRQRLENLPQHYAQYDAVVGWTVRIVGSEIIVEGEIRNVRYMYMSNVEVWVRTLDVSGRTIASAVDFVLPRMLPYNDAAPFKARIPVSSIAAKKLRFTYKYTAYEGASDGGGDIGNWNQSFDADMPRLPSASPL